MLSERRTTPESEQKLTILQALCFLQPVSDLQLCTFLAGTGLTDYLSAQMDLMALQASRLIASSPHPLGILLVLTDAGQETLRAFQNRLPLSVRTLLREHADTFCPVFRKENSISAFVSELPDGRFCLRLRLIEEKSVQLDMTLITANRRDTVDLRQRWAQSAESVYHLVCRALSDNWEKKPCDATSSTDPLLQGNVYPAPGASGNSALGHNAFGNTAFDHNASRNDTSEWIVYLTHGDELSLSLSLPDRDLACHYAERWKAVENDLSAEIPRLLAGSVKDRDQSLSTGGVNC